MWSALLLALVPVATHPPIDLVAAASASGRPAECMPTRAHGKRNVWTDARSPRVGRYCNLISRAHVRLALDLTAAEAAAHAADALIPGRAAPKVVLARVALARGSPETALGLFEAALAIDRRSVEQPSAMHDLARAQKKSGKLKEALGTYRVLVPRASLLPSRVERAQVLLEAAHVALAAAEDEQRAVDEALAYLREASRDRHHPLRIDVALSLVLALQRGGHRAQADAVLAEQRGLRAWMRAVEGPGQASYWAQAGDRALFEGLALERDQPREAVARYRKAIEAGPGPHAEVARERLNAIDGVPGRQR